ncbi:hypothetical protein [Streptomyces sp. NPDC056227]|uniref:hypothetical protein n=1 Tax=Streptomyces sp. NPDC056227 TaxID=3345753 RepID=UPI0035DB4386
MPPVLLAPPVLPVALIPLALLILMVLLVSLPGMTAVAPMWSGWIRITTYRWYRGQQSALFWVDTSAVGDALHKPSTTI